MQTNFITFSNNRRVLTSESSLKPKIKVLVFPLKGSTLYFRPDPAIFIAIFEKKHKQKDLFTYRPFLCMKILDKI